MVFSQIDTINAQQTYNTKDHEHQFDDGTQIFVGYGKCFWSHLDIVKLNRRKNRYIHTNPETYAILMSICGVMIDKRKVTKCIQKSVSIHVASDLLLEIDKAPSLAINNFVAAAAAVVGI